MEMEKGERLRKGSYGGMESVPYPVSRIGWGAVFAGFFIATVTQILLNALGVAIGLSAFRPGSQISGAAIGIGAGIWTIVASVIALFVGAWVAGRYTVISERGEGSLQGALVWAFSLLFVVWFAAMGVGSALGGLMGIVGQGVAGGAQGAVSRMGAGPPRQGFEIGKGGAGGEESSAVDRERTINTLMGTTHMSREQAEKTVDQLGLTGRSPEPMREQAKETAAAGAQYGAAAAWWFFITALLSLGAAIWGGQVGLRNRDEEYARIART